MKDTQIRETVSAIQEFSNIDEAAHVIRDVKVLGLESKNNRYYPKETVAAAVKLYEGVRVNVNHTDHPHQSRRYEERIGVLRGVHLKDGDKGLYGNFHYNPKHVLAEQLIWDAKNLPENVGFSHDVTGVTTTDKKSGKVIVEEITAVRSVDLVADPATTNSLYESEGTMEPETAVAPAPEAPPVEADPKEAVKAAFKAKILKILDGDGDVTTMKTEIGNILKQQEKAMKALGDQPAETPSGETPPETPPEEEEKESVKTKEGKEAEVDELAKLKEENDLLKLRQEFTDAGINKPKDYMLEAAKSVEGENRQKLIESFKPNDSEKPRNSFPGESIAKQDAKSFAESIT